jgi:hypothetical protein
MNPQDFCYWLDGYLFPGGPLTVEEVDQIKRELASVLAGEKVQHEKDNQARIKQCYISGHIPTSMLKNTSPLTEEDKREIDNYIERMWGKKSRIYPLPFVEGCYSHGYTPSSCTSDPNTPPKKP